jgi:hypothetical protein
MTCTFVPSPVSSRIPKFLVSRIFLFVQIFLLLDPCSPVCIVVLALRLIPRIPHRFAVAGGLVIYPRNAFIAFRARGFSRPSSGVFQGPAALSPDSEFESSGLLHGVSRFSGG